MGILSDLINNPMETIIELLYMIPIILISLTLHEVAHGYVAYKCGDPTAAMLGRLSLNPLKHLDPLGTLFMFIAGVGYAKPVPVNSRNFRHFRRDDMLVSVAGITVNFCLFLLASVLMVFVQKWMFTPDIYEINFVSGYSSDVHNLTALDLLSIKSGYLGMYMLTDSYTMLVENGLAQFLRSPVLLYIQRFLMLFSLTNLGLALFNLLPIPPLDGSHLFNDILFRGKLNLSPQVTRIINIAFILLLVFTNIISSGISHVRNFLQDGVMRGLLLIFGGL